AGIAALKADDLATAGAAAVELETTLAGLLSGARGEEALGTSDASLRLVAAAAIKWKQALSTAYAEIAEFKAMVVADAEEDEELDPEEVDDIAGRLDDLDEIPVELEALAPVLEDLAGADGQARDAAIRALLAGVAETRSYLQSNEWAPVLRDPGAAQITFVSDCLGVLGELETAVQG
ncbi:MAG: hypothetical protein ACREFY_15125, partial [Acetobacteraceae bacterium]